MTFCDVISGKKFSAVLHEGSKFDFMKLDWNGRILMEKSQTTWWQVMELYWEGSHMFVSDNRVISIIPHVDLCFPTKIAHFYHEPEVRVNHLKVPGLIFWCSFGGRGGSVRGGRGMRGGVRRGAAAAGVQRGGRGMRFGGRGGRMSRGTRGRGGRGRGRGAANGTKPPTREDLDNQLDAYMSKTKSALDAELDSYMAQTGE